VGTYEIVSEVGQVELHEGIKLPRRVRLRIHGEPGDPIPFDGEGRLRMIGGRMEVTHLSLQQVEGGPPVTGETLRGAPRRLARAVVQRLHKIDLTDAGFAIGMVRLGADAKEMAKAGPSDLTLSLVASIYRLAYVTDDPPAKTVHALMGIPRSTAGRWIMAARKKGFLGPAEPRKAGEVETTKEA
jgi:hypothetical protein